MGFEIVKQLFKGNRWGGVLGDSLGLGLLFGRRLGGITVEER